MLSAKVSLEGSSAGSEALVVRNLRKTYGDSVAVDSVSLTIFPGTCYGLLGPNGAGKTTTISMISGTIPFDSGEIVISGYPVKAGNSEIKHRIGYVPQELALYEDLTAIDNLRFFGMLYRLEGKHLADRMEFALEISGLESRRKGIVREFSGGMKRRLNIALALLHDPDLIILDEPTVGVDPQSRNLIFKVLEDLCNVGKTLLYTTHYMEEVERLCQRVAIMDAGKIVVEGDLSSLYSLVPQRTVLKIMVEGSSGTRSTIDFDIHDMALELSRVLPEKIAEVVAKGGIVTDIRTERPTLEEVFIHLTGHALRE